ncbi:MAG: 16S rRNA (cytosine(1402)-N(4))-methyltransferase RsmH [Bacillota bacterium]
MKEVIEFLNCRPGGIYIDCTLGEGGHTLEILARIGPRGKLLGVDQDTGALAIAAKRLETQGWVPSPGPTDTDERDFTDSAGSSATLIHANFAELDVVLSSHAIPPVDGVLFDLGASSRQFDTPQRGFSYMHDAPLDMRMDAGQPVTAHDVVNGWDQAELARILFEYGEERWARRIAQFIIEARARRPIETTGELVEVIKAAIPAGARRHGPHPAKRTFQALRIAVNDELEAVKDGLAAALRAVKPGGRVVVISFHSLEDRAVKRTFKEAAEGRFHILTKKPVTPSDAELNDNPRARSAKLRAVEAAF